MKLRWLAFLPVAAFAVQAWANPEKQAFEKKALKDFIAIYNSSKTPFELRKRLLTLKEVDANQAAYLFGESYFRPLPKLSYDLEKMQLRVGDATVVFTDLSEGEAKVNGKPFKYDRTKSFTRNYATMLNLYQSKGPIGERKGATLERLFIERAQAGTAFPQYAEGWVISEFPGSYSGAFKQRVGTSIMRETKGENGPDVDLYDGLERVVHNPGKAGAAAATGLGLLGAGIGLAPLIVTLPIHAGVVHAHAYLVAPSCERQAVEIAESLNKDSISMSEVNCTSYANITEHSSISFWQKDETSLQVFANWDKGEAWVNPDQLLKFDEKKLTEVRELHYTDPQGVPKDRIRVLNTELHIYKEGDPKFEGIKKNIEPMRKVLEIFGRNLSCYKCESYFKENLVLKRPGKYDINKLKTKAGFAADSPSNKGSAVQ